MCSPFCFPVVFMEEIQDSFYSHILEYEIPYVVIYKSMLLVAPVEFKLFWGIKIYIDNRQNNINNKLIVITLCNTL